MVAVHISQVPTFISHEVCKESCAASGNAHLDCA